MSAVPPQTIGEGFGRLRMVPARASLKPLFG
jgi:hypothetical protein